MFDCRMMANREPALQRVRDVLETHPAARRLVCECRLCRRRSHNWRQFPARSKSAVTVSNERAVGSPRAHQPEADCRSAPSAQPMANPR